MFLFWPNVPPYSEGNPWHLIDAALFAVVEPVGNPPRRKPSIPAKMTAGEGFARRVEPRDRGIQRAAGGRASLSSTSPSSFWSDWKLAEALRSG